MIDRRANPLKFSPPQIGEEEIAEVEAALRSGWLSRGPRTARFEKEFAEHLGAPAALGLNSCTAGLHLALLTLDIGPGDEVIVPTMTFVASVNVVEHVGAKPVLVDVEPDTLNLDPAAVEAAVTPQTRAIMAVHYAGHPADLDALETIAARHGLAVVEDAAHSLPARFNGRMIGSSNNLTAFSFYATKNLTTGEGGMLTGDPALVDRARVLSLHGMQGEAWNRYESGGAWFYRVVAPGYKYNMTDIQAALGTPQLAKLSGMQDRRRKVVDRYDEAFSRVDGIQTPVVRAGVESAYHLYPLRLQPDVLGVTRDQVIAGLNECGIGTSVHFIPVHLHAFYRDRYGYSPEDFPVALDAFERLLTIPLHPGLTDQDVADVIGAVFQVVGVDP